MSYSLCLHILTQHNSRTGANQSCSRKKLQWEGTTHLNTRRAKQITKSKVDRCKIPSQRVPTWHVLPVRPTADISVAPEVVFI